ncbi:hypothetical protein THAOC_32484 [Thalassiosira oceanica]|uniref:Uncharacterized protein n=1 Tax=Thalassiosira oceanica TaxID=159749 RepID=K0RIL1_THAOC|nr:hypothetical protein THAOC_32484 [Thalassiosira oceanica]|eukprot:EJK48696.1 hypothetical protein THAOC_32484 [Thalassiosira oceanica]
MDGTWLGGGNGGSIGGTAVVCGVSSLVGGVPVTSLDFEDVERELAGRLTDDHLESMLRLVDAATGLQILKLAGCTNITGSGLRPLRGSRVLRQVDFTLRGNHEAAKEEEEESQLSKEEVVSFLQSLLDGGGGGDAAVKGEGRFVPAGRSWHGAEGRLGPGVRSGKDLICVECESCKDSTCELFHSFSARELYALDAAIFMARMMLILISAPAVKGRCVPPASSSPTVEDTIGNCNKICGDCNPPDFECLWCDCGESEYYGQGRQGQLCEQCCPGVSTTKCTYCRKEKLFLKNYPLPDVPSSHWLGRGLTDEYIAHVTDFLRAMKVATLMLRSSDKEKVKLYQMQFLHHRGFSELINEVENAYAFHRFHQYKTQLRHDDALVPYWQQFTNALKTYDGILDEDFSYENHYYHQQCFRLASIELHPSVIDMLGPALATCITSLSLHDVGRGWVDLAISVIGANSSLKYLSCSANPSRMERAFDLFSSVADHPTLSDLTLRKICSDGAEGYSLFMLAKICLLDGDSGSSKTYRLKFSGNSMSSNGATHIADAIASNSSRLKELDLTSNKLTDTDARAIGQALRSNTTLERLCVQGNDFTQVGVAAIRLGVGEAKFPANNCMVSLSDSDLSEYSDSEV